MKIAFVFAPYSHKKFEENISVVDEDFGIFPPINLAYAAAIAEIFGGFVAGGEELRCDELDEREAYDRDRDPDGRFRGGGGDLVGRLARVRGGVHRGPGDPVRPVERDPGQ